MSDELRDACSNLEGDEHWNDAVQALYQAAIAKRQSPLPQLPAGYKLPASMQALSLLQRGNRTSWRSSARCPRRSATRWPEPIFRRSIR